MRAAARSSVAVGMARACCWREACVVDRARWSVVVDARFAFEFERCVCDRETLRDRLFDDVARGLGFLERGVVCEYEMC